MVDRLGSPSFVWLPPTGAAAKMTIVPGRRPTRILPPQWGLLADGVLDVAIETGDAGPGAAGHRTQSGDGHVARLSVQARRLSSRLLLSSRGNRSAEHGIKQIVFSFPLIHS